MPIYTGVVRRVEKPKHGSAIRYEVLLVEGPMVYTWDALKALLCERAALLGLPVNVHTRDTKYGNEIVQVELAQQEDVA